jgi:hypothetical protein
MDSCWPKFKAPTAIGRSFSWVMCSDPDQGIYLSFCVVEYCLVKPEALSWAGRPSKLFYHVSEKFFISQGSLSEYSD